jgi:hypothetical protein
MIDTGTLFWLWAGWVAIVTATMVVWWYESQVVAGYKRRAERLADELEATRNRLAGARR